MPRASTLEPLTTAMFVQDFSIVDRPCEDVVRHLRRHLDRVLGGAVNDTRSAGEALQAKVAPASWPDVLAPTVVLHLGPVRPQGSGVLLAFSWETPGASSLFPRLEADLEVTPFGTSETSLALRGRYDPPAGFLGRKIDELLLHRLAEATVRAFLDGVRTRLEPPSGPGRSPGQRGSAKDPVPG